MGFGFEVDTRAMQATGQSKNSTPAELRTACAYSFRNRVNHGVRSPPRSNGMDISSRQVTPSLIDGRRCMN